MMDMDTRPPWWKPYQRKAWELLKAAEYSDAVKAANSRSPRSYIVQARTVLLDALRSLGDTTDWNDPREQPLLDLYVLLVLTVGTECTNKHVHDAWAVARQRSRPDHPDLAPYDQVNPDVQEYDTLYRTSIRFAAVDLRGRKTGT